MTDDQTKRDSKAGHDVRFYSRGGRKAFARGASELASAPTHAADAVIKTLNDVKVFQVKGFQVVRSDLLPKKKSTRDRVLSNLQTTTGRVRRDMKDVG